MKWPDNVSRPVADTLTLDSPTASYSTAYRWSKK